ncbi:hypothetical protein GYB22_12645 [bacterium]|nr:hypothetical protein [bacterium]
MELQALLESIVNPDLRIEIVDHEYPSNYLKDDYGELQPDYRNVWKSKSWIGYIGDLKVIQYDDETVNDIFFQNLRADIAKHLRNSKQYVLSNARKSIKNYLTQIYKSDKTDKFYSHALLGDPPSIWVNTKFDYDAHSELSFDLIQSEAIFSTYFKNVYELLQEILKKIDYYNQHLTTSKTDILNSLEALIHPTLTVEPFEYIVTQADIGNYDETRLSPYSTRIPFKEIRFRAKYKGETIAETSNTNEAYNKRISVRYLEKKIVQINRKLLKIASEEDLVEILSYIEADIISISKDSIFFENYKTAIGWPSSEEPTIKVSVNIDIDYSQLAENTCTPDTLKYLLGPYFEQLEVFLKSLMETINEKVKRIRQLASPNVHSNPVGALSSPEIDNLVKSITDLYIPDIAIVKSLEDINYHGKVDLPTMEILGVGAAKSWIKQHPVWIGTITGRVIYKRISGGDIASLNQEFYNLHKPYFNDQFYKVKAMLEKQSIKKENLIDRLIYCQQSFYNSEYAHDNYVGAEPEFVKILVNPNYDYKKHLDVFTSVAQAQFELSGYFESFLQFSKDLLNYLRSISDKTERRLDSPTRGLRKVSVKGAWSDFEVQRDSILAGIEEFLVEKRKFIGREYAGVLCELLNKANNEVVIPWNGTAEMLNAFLTGIKANPNFKKGQVWNHFKGNFKYKGKQDVWVNTSEKDLRKNSGYDPDHPHFKKIVEFGKNL